MQNKVEVQGKPADLLGRLGVSAEVVDRRLLSRVPLQALKNLTIAYGTTLIDDNKFAKDISDSRVNIPPFCYNPSPQAALTQNRSTVRRTYTRAAGPQRHESHRELLQALFDRETQRGVKAARLLHKSEPVRRSFERTAGARVVLDGRADGAVSLNTTPTPATGVSTSAMSSVPSMPSRERFYELMMGMDAAVLQQAQNVQLANIAQSGGGGGGFTSLGGSSMFGPTLGSSSGDSSEEEGGESTSSSSSSLGLVGSSFGPGGTPMGTQNPVNQPGTQTSVDLATLHLKRLMDKRDQMYDLFRQVNDKHNQAANTAVNNMRA